MTFADAIRTCFRKYVTFSGRATRPEYWYFLPVGCLWLLLAHGIAAILHVEPWTYIVIMTIALLPLLAVTTRRLRDSGADLSGVRIPTQALVGFIAFGWASIEFFLWWTTGMALSDGPAGFGSMFFGWFVMPILGFGAIHFFLLGLLTGPALFAQMASPSKEVTQ